MTSAGQNAGRNAAQNAAQNAAKCAAQNAAVDARDARTPARTPATIAQLIDQPLVRDFLSTAAVSGSPSHAYLFAGPLGAGKTEAAEAFAKALLCPRGGCGACEECIRVAHHTHPDYHVVEPMGATGYLAEQMAELLHDASLSPVRAALKVYLITRADLLRGVSANALLKTLEEPQGAIVFILLARTRDSVLPTIASRCQVLPFRTVPEADAVRSLIERTSANEQTARMALASTGGSRNRAEGFIRSSSRREARKVVLEAMERLDRSDGLDILEAVKEVFTASKQPLDTMKGEHSKQLEAGKGNLGAGALKRLESQQKRELSARERETTGEILDVIRSWLRDILLVRISRGALIVNHDFHHHVERLAAVLDEAACARCLMAVDRAQEQIQYNVSKELAVEALLFTIRKELSLAKRTHAGR
jgi:DNA polymerase-3 subunit delta'